jgi:predicted O-methyltransferase YrrM
MTTLAILLILIALGLYGLKEYYQIKTGVVLQHTPEASVTYLSQILERSTDSGTFVQLGSAYGGCVIRLAKLLPTWQITGVEFSPTPWIVANLRTIGKNFGNYRFFLNDPTQWPLKDYSVVFIHQDPKIVKQWEAAIARRLQPGTLLISYNAPLPRIKPIETLVVNPQTTLYVYRRAASDESNAPTLPIDQPEPIVNTPPPPPVVEDAPQIQPELELPL